MVHDLPLHSAERKFFTDFCMKAWKAEHDIATTAGLYLVLFGAYDYRYPVEGVGMLADGGALIIREGLHRKMGQKIQEMKARE
jgi:hypothetical protein